MTTMLRNRSIRTAERIKITLGNAYPLEQQLTMEVKGRRASSARALVEGAPAGRRGRAVMCAWV